MNNPHFDSLVSIGHNISQDNLLFIHRHLNGTLIAPSFFVTKASHSINEFGEFTLNPAPNLIEEIITNTYSADMMTPHLRQLTFDIPNRGAITDLVNLFRVHGKPILDREPNYDISESQIAYILEGGEIHAYRQLKREPLITYVFSRMIDCAPSIDETTGTKQLESYLYMLVESNQYAFKTWVDNFSIPLLGTGYVTADNGAMEGLGTPEHLLHFVGKDMGSVYTELWGVGMAKAALAYPLRTKVEILRHLHLIGGKDSVAESIEVVDDTLEDLELFISDYTNRDFLSSIEFHKAVGEYVLSYISGKDATEGLRSLLTDDEDDSDIDDLLNDGEWKDELDSLLMDAASSLKAMKVPLFESKPLRLISLSEFESATYMGEGEPRRECVELLSHYGIPLKLSPSIR